MSRVIVALLSLVLLLAVLLTGGIGYWWHQVHQPLEFSPQEQIVEIKAGENVRSLSRTLEQAGIVPAAWLFESWARYRQQGGALKTGEYAVTTGTTIPALLELFVGGKSVQYRVTIPEGVTARELVEILHGNEKLARELKGEDVLAQLNALTGREHAEGWFFPDTYFFNKGASDKDILQQAFKKMQAELERAWAGRDKDLPLKSPEEALTLASIVEKETGAAEERPTIAGVFVNRLRKGMKLQTDPTVIYGMGDRYQGNIRKSDLRRDTPYNTYTRTGLPPTPIALPGREALEAAVHPAKTDALYFVAKGGGRHYFSTTYREHKKAVVKYLLGGNAKRYKGDSQ